jgi:hypothetical protein
VPVNSTIKLLGLSNTAKTYPVPYLDFWRRGAGYGEVIVHSHE